jgi:hypothetical protein
MNVSLVQETGVGNEKYLSLSFFVRLFHRGNGRLVG